mgnify:FL=1
MALYNNSLAVVRQYLSDAVGDLIMGTFASGTTTTGVHTMLRRADDYYNHHGFRCYIYGGTNIGAEREISDWVNSTHTLTLDPAFASAIDSTSKYELHYMFVEDEYRKAINLAIESLAGKYLVDLKDETTIRLTSTTDNQGNTVYTYEYSLPTSFLYLEKVFVEEGVDGRKLTGTVSGTFTAGETVTGGTSGAKGEFSYQGSGYIRVRKTTGTFVTGETATGASSGAKCESITKVESETAGMDVWYDEDEIDPRSWEIVRAFTPKLRINQTYISSFDEDLFLRLEGQGTQPIVDDDTDVIYLPPDWVVQKAITFLPQAKIQSNKLDNIYRQSLLLSAREPLRGANPFSRRIVE